VNLWATAAQAAVYTLVSITLGLLYKRAVKRERERIERVLEGVEAVFGIATTNIPKKGIMQNIDLKQFRKAIAAGIAAAVGVIFTGILTWLSTSGVVASLLEPIVPDALKPVAAVLAGGIASGAAIVLAVYKTTNYPAAQPVLDDAAATAVTAQPARTVSTDTAYVELLPAPEPAYL
jgi:hypothetical protein